MFEILEYKPYKRNEKHINIKTAKNITINLRKLLLMNKTYTHKVNINKELSTIRLDKILTNKVGKLSRMQIKMLIKSGNVKLNNIPILDPSYLVRENDSFEISILKPKEVKYTAEDITLDIIYDSSSAWK